MLNIVKQFLKVANTRSLASFPSATTALKPQQSPEIQFESRFVQPREVWVESLETEEENVQGIMQLHPKIFAETPRMDIIHLNVEWQRFVL
jgi:hypothetical protein